jgi:nucleotide-binding universal stress UspA family protein
MLTLDGSELAREAAPRARALAKQFGGHVIVLGVLPCPEGPSPFSMEGARIADERDAHAHLDAVAEALRAEGISVEVMTTRGDAGERIVEEAEALGCDAIVMATHGRSGLGRALIGSVAEYVVRHSRGAAVVLVRNHREAVPDLTPPAE